MQPIRVRGYGDVTPGRGGGGGGGGGGWRGAEVEVSGQFRQCGSRVAASDGDGAHALRVRGGVSVRKV